jgi:hypothetical protein
VSEGSSKIRILFVLEKRVNAGSIQAVSSYVRVGDEFGHTIAVYGRTDPDFPSVRYSTDVSAFDYVILIYESKLRWMSELELAHILSGAPRQRRAILDADGMYNQLINLDDYDRNHWSEHERSEWLEHYEQLADRILQPTTEPRESRVTGLPFYGYDPGMQVRTVTAESKRFDLMYVGHNWWRWREVTNTLLPAIEQIRTQLQGVCFVGLWWDAVQPWAVERNVEAAFQVDPDWFRRTGVEVKSPVPYTQVIPTMSEGRVNIMTQRPVLRYLKMLTSKYFEIFCADTIPLVVLDPDHAESVYGPAGRELTLQEAMADKLLDVLHRPQHYQELVEEVRRHLEANHSYHRRVQELVAALQAGAQ